MDLLQLSTSSSAATDQQQRRDWQAEREPLPLVQHPRSKSFVFPQWVRSPRSGGATPWLDALPPYQHSHSSEHHQQQHHSSSDMLLADELALLGSGATPRSLFRTWAVACILPVGEVCMMSAHHWSELYSLERRYLPVDCVHERPILGHVQPHITRDHRHRIVSWMGEACSLFHWSSLTFFTAVHAWDRFVTTAPFELQTADLARISASCLYFGAQMVESAADENVKSLDEFAEMCPEVGTPSALREVQTILVDTLQGTNCVRRTAADWLQLYLAVLQVAPSPCPQLYELLLQTRMLEAVWDCALSVAMVVTTSGISLDGLPLSRWVAGTLLRLLEAISPPLRTDAQAKERLMTCVFHLPPLSLDAFQATILDPIIRAVWQTLQEQRRGQQLRATNWDSDEDRQWRPPYWILRHKNIPPMDKCPVSVPTNSVVQEISTRLRAAALEKSTPPTLAGQQQQQQHTASSIKETRAAGPTPQQQHSSSHHLHPHQQQQQKYRTTSLSNASVAPGYPY